MAKYMPFEEHFRQKFAVLENGCWLWKAATNGWGYGRFQSEKGKIVAAHRWSYERFSGPIPSGMDLDHLCRNRACVNPKHLEPVSRRTNLLRGYTLAAKLAAKTHCANGHEFNFENTYRYGPNKRLRSCRVCNRNQKRKK